MIGTAKSASVQRFNRFQANARFQTSWKRELAMSAADQTKCQQ